MEKFGLLGRNISYSFSKAYFTKKFSAEKIDATYENFDIPDISHFSKIKKTPNLHGLNVTIPYKEQVLPFLDSLDNHAQQIGAVNTIKICENGHLKGFNTDFLGFKNSITPYLASKPYKALILGTGGASKAVAYALQQLNIPNFFVSRKTGQAIFQYEKIDQQIMDEHQIIINCTPLGTYPNTEEVPAVPLQYINENHLVFDLIYNPSITKLMLAAKQNGATVCNGQQMLEIQAEEAWKIWNS